MKGEPHGLQGGFLITGPPGKSQEPFSGNHRKAYFNKMRKWELRRRKDLGSREQKIDHRGTWTRQLEQSKPRVNSSHVACPGVMGGGGNRRVNGADGSSDDPWSQGLRCRDLKVPALYHKLGSPGNRPPSLGEVLTITL